MNGGPPEGKPAEDESILARAAPAPDAIVRYGALPEQFAEVRYGRAADAARRPLLLLLHGGFWRPAYDLKHMSPLAAMLAAAGWTVANVEYRRVPGEPEAGAGDLQTAVRQLPLEISMHDGRVVLVGFSAGGHWALWLAAQRAPVAAVLALAPLASLKQARVLGLSGDAVLEFLGTHIAESAAWDPAALPAPTMPVRLLHGSADRVVPPELSLRYVRRHPASGIRLYPGVGHFELIDPDISTALSLLEVLRDVSR